MFCRNLYSFDFLLFFFSWHPIIQIFFCLFACTNFFLKFSILGTTQPELKVLAPNFTLKT